MGLRSFLFKKRSYTPVPIVIAVIYYSEPYKPFWIYGVFLIFLGEIIRFNAVRHAGGRTRTTNVGSKITLHIRTLFKDKKSSLYRQPIYLFWYGLFCRGDIYG